MSDSLFKVHLKIDPSIQKTDLEKALESMSKYITSIWVAQKPPGFAFVWLVSESKMQQFIETFNGQQINGHEIKCAVSTSRGRKEPVKAPEQDDRDRSRSKPRRHKSRDHSKRRSSRSRSRNKHKRRDHSRSRSRSRTPRESKHRHESSRHKKE